MLVTRCGFYCLIRNFERQDVFLGCAIKHDSHSWLVQGCKPPLKNSPWDFLCQASRKLRVISPSTTLAGSRSGTSASTGLSGALRNERHGTAKRRSWRKLHIGIDADSGEIVAFDLTDKDVDDASHVEPLLDQLAGEPASFMGDGAYDRLAFSKAFWREIRALNSSCLHVKEP
jgi:hypothetical protein